MAEPWEKAFQTVAAHPHYTMSAGVIFFIVVLLICCLCVCSSLAYAFIEKKKVCGMKLVGGQFGCKPDPTTKKCISPADAFANIAQYEGFEAENYEDADADEYEEEDYDDESYDDEQFDEYDY